MPETEPGLSENLSLAENVSGLKDKHRKPNVNTSVINGN
jgi:hypothetical protein